MTAPAQHGDSGVAERDSVANAFADPESERGTMVSKPQWWLITLLVQPLLAERCAAFLRSAQAASLLQAHDHLPRAE